MNLSKCSRCGGPRRSLSQPVCAKCRKHPVDTCSRCGKKKLESSALCRTCHIADALVIRHKDARRPPEGYEKRRCACGGFRRLRAKQCWTCYVAELRSLQPEVTFDADGYAYVLVLEHRDAGKAGRGYRIRRARLVGEQQIGRPLDPYEVPHHLNLCPSDDRPENVAVLTKKEHRLIHAAYRKEAKATG